MKIKNTKSDEYKVTMSLYELELFTSIMMNVQLGAGTNSGIIKNFLELVEAHSYVDSKDCDQYTNIGFSVDVQPGKPPNFSIIVD